MKKKNKDLNISLNGKYKDFIIGSLLFAFAILMFCFVTCIFNMDLRVPLSYAGDLSGMLINFKSVLRGGDWTDFHALGAPFGTNMWRQLWDAPIPCLFMVTIAKLTNNVALGINIYYILSFGLSAICAYYMLRKCGIDCKYAFVGAMAYAFIPGHIQREENHLFVGSCFAIPLVVLAGFELYNGLSCKEDYSQKEKLSFCELLMSGSKSQFVGICFFVLVSLCTIYYGIFALMYLTFCVFMCIVRTKKLRHIFYYIEYVIAELFCILIIYLPQILANKFNPVTEKVSVVTRNMQDTEYYAGKFIQYILPVSGHRIGVLSKLRYIYDSTFPMVNENTKSSLGLVMALGFLIGLIVCFIGTSEKELEKYGKIELFLFLVSTVGGIGAIVGMINCSLRCYNRFSYFIGAVAIVIIMSLVQLIGTKMEKKWGKNVSTALSMILLCVILFDQTTLDMAYSAKDSQFVQYRYQNDKNFVEAIEAFEGENADILVYPLMNAQEAAYSYTEDEVYLGYVEQMLYVQSNTSNWSIGSKGGEKSERWINWLKQQDVSQQIEIAAVTGMEGIAIYRGGYEEEKYQSVNNEIRSVLGNANFTDDTGLWEYYSLGEERENILSRLTEEEKDDLYQKYTQDFLGDDIK